MPHTAAYAGVIKRKTLPGDVYKFLTHEEHKALRLRWAKGRCRGFQMDGVVYGGITSMLKKRLWPTYSPRVRGRGDGLGKKAAKQRGVQVEDEVECALRGRNKEHRRELRARSSSLAQKVLQCFDDHNIEITHTQYPIRCPTTRHATAVDFVGVSGDKVVFVELKTVSGNVEKGNGRMKGPMEKFSNCAQNQFQCQLAWPMDIAQRRFNIHPSRIMGVAIRVCDNDTRVTVMPKEFLSFWSTTVYPYLTTKAQRFPPKATRCRPAKRSRARSKSRSKSKSESRAHKNPRRK